MTTPTVAKLKILHKRAEIQAVDLATTLEEIRDIYWGGCEDSPLFRLTPDTKSLLKDIEVILAAPTSQIECAA